VKTSGAIDVEAYDMQVQGGHGYTDFHALLQITKFPSVQAGTGGKAHTSHMDQATDVEAGHEHGHSA
jgi:hypothetical protein